ncbi:MAG: S41 family peptidase [Pseudomonadota bacterium]
MTTAVSAETMLTAEQLQDDLRAWMEWVAETHPKLDYTTDLETLDATVESLSAKLNGQYTPREAWLALSVLNPLFSDAHVGLRYPERRYQAAVRAGGVEFSAPVRVQEGRLFVADTIGPKSVLQPGDQIIAINAIPAATIVHSLMIRMRGETDTLRSFILSTRFSGALWALTGNAEEYTVDVMRSGEPLTGLRLHPDRDAVDQPPVPFNFSIVDDVAVLKVDSFDRSLEAEFLAFLESSFQAITDSGSRHVVVDLRENGGGAEELSSPLMTYLTDQRIASLSEITARITAENQALIPGASLGDVVSVPFENWIEPTATLANRFEGEVFILVGPNTYSQSIVFAAAAQDAGIAKIVGRPTEGAVNQTGQVQRFELPESGLLALAPIYMFTRASGETGRSPLMPDMTLAGEGDEQLELLIARIVE